MKKTITALKNILDVAAKIDSNNEKVVFSKFALMHYLRQAVVMSDDLDESRSPDFGRKWGPYIVAAINDFEELSDTDKSANDNIQAVIMVLDLATIEAKRMMSA